MSTKIATIKGVTEIPERGNASSVYQTKFIMISRFYGGEDRGTCISLQLGNSSIQLARDEIMYFADVLRNYEYSPELND